MSSFYDFKHVCGRMFKNSFPRHSVKFEMFLLVFHSEECHTGGFYSERFQCFILKGFSAFVKDKIQQHIFPFRIF